MASPDEPLGNQIQPPNNADSDTPMQDLLFDMPPLDNEAWYNLESLDEYAPPLTDSSGTPPQTTDLELPSQSETAIVDHTEFPPQTTDLGFLAGVEGAPLPIDHPHTLDQLNHAFDTGDWSGLFLDPPGAQIAELEDPQLPVDSQQSFNPFSDAFDVGQRPDALPQSQVAQADSQLPGSLETNDSLAPGQSQPLANGLSAEIPAEVVPQAEDFNFPAADVLQWDATLASLLSPEQRPTMAAGSTDSNGSQVLVDQSSKKRARSQGNFKVNHKYPAVTTPLPANISLEEICRSYPNHLQGVHLRRFIHAGWMGKRIYDNMNPDAHEAGNRPQPSQRISARLRRERQRMEDEGISFSMPEEVQFAKYWSASSTADQSTDPTILDESNDAGDGISETDHDVLQGGQLLSAEDAQSASRERSRSPSRSGIAFFPDQRTTILRAFKSEVLRQTATLSELRRRQEPDWPPADPDALVARLRVSWLAFAHDQESRIANEHGIVLSSLPHDNGTDFAIFERLVEMCRLSQRQQKLLGADDLEGPSLAVLNGALSVVQGWTDLLIKQAETIMPEPQSTPSSTPARDGGAEFSTPPLPSNDTPDVLSPAPPSQHHSQSATPAADWPNPTPGPSRSTILWSARANRRFTSDTNQLPTVRDPGRGPPRVRMFPTFPDKTHPLTEQDFAQGPNHILDHFPEHLADYDVMLRFCSPPGVPRGGYSTLKIVARLAQHPTALDASHPDKRDKEAALYQWVACKKSIANQRRNGKNQARRDPKESLRPRNRKKRVAEEDEGGDEAGEEEQGPSQTAQAGYHPAMATTTTTTTTPDGQFSDLPESEMADLLMAAMN